MLKLLLNYWDMGGYGIYIWPCYSLLLIIISWMLFAALRRNILIHNKIKQDLWSGSNSDKQA